MWRHTSVDYRLLIITLVPHGKKAVTVDCWDRILAVKEMVS
jgi:hypothetical protein